MSETFYKAGRIVRQSLPLLVFLVFVEILAGQFLNPNDALPNKRIMLSAGLLMLIPALNGIGGNIGSVLAARLTSGLHVGSVEPSLKDKNIRKNVALAFALGVSVYSIMGLIIYGITRILDMKVRFSFGELFLIFMGSGMILITLLCIICVLSVIISYDKGVDPDNIVTPVVTTMGDFIGIVSILLMSLIVGLL